MNRPDTQPAKKRAHFWRFFPLYFSLFYLTSFGPATFLVSRLPFYIQQKAAPPFILFYALHFWSMKASETYYHYGYWWVSPSRPPMKWEDWKQAFP